MAAGRTVLAAWLSLVTLACSPRPADDDAGAGDYDAAACPHLEPPDALLTTLVGVQSGIQGSYCGEFKETGCIRCVDREVGPEQVSVVRPGDDVTFSMPQGRLVEGENCSPACPPKLRIQRVDCGRVVSEQERRVTEDRPWAVELEPGVYVLVLESRVDRATSGWQGEMSAFFGLIVDETRERGIIGASAVAERCDDDGGAAMP